jgi:hypothetical protein
VGTTDLDKKFADSSKMTVTKVVQKGTSIILEKEKH